tara:strand:- start:695 stop:973 length:279 start_codon:yes stop_codon:yes gene_type:complete
MKIGDLVWNHYHGMLRFGTITGKEIKEDKWAYFTVDWHADDRYEEAQDWRKTLTGTDYKLKEYRCDLLRKFDPDRLEKVLMTYLYKKGRNSK